MKGNNEDGLGQRAERKVERMEAERMEGNVKNSNIYKVILLQSGEKNEVKSEIKSEVRSRSEIYDRGVEGFMVYAKGMAGSIGEKARILPYVKPGRIVEMGCGNGVVLELLVQSFPDSEIIGVDISDTMLKMAVDRKYDGKRKNVTLVKEDITKMDLRENSLDTIIFCSTLHELFSYNGYSKNVVRETIEKAYRALRPGGRLIIRDGVKPEAEEVYLEFKNEETRKKFYRFAFEFGPREIQFASVDDEPNKVEKVNKVRLRSEDAMEFLSKYIYDKNWKIEVKEQFGVYTFGEYRVVLEEHGFDVVHAESYLLEWLRRTHYEKDLDVFKLVNGRFVKQEYPDSTMILVAEKGVPTKVKLRVGVDGAGGSK